MVLHLALLFLSLATAVSAGSLVQWEHRLLLLGAQRRRGHLTHYRRTYGPAQVQS